MQPISPCLWFDGQAEEAANFYVSVIPNSRITNISRYGDEGLPGSESGKVMMVNFELNGGAFAGLNGGPMFSFTPAVSFVLNVESQAEVDRLWDALTQDGEPGQCGWLVDKFGVSWQVVPEGLPELLGDPDPERAQRATAAMMAMSKLDIEAMRAAADGR